MLGEIALAAGNPEAAEAPLREALRVLSSIGHAGSVVEAQRQLADVMLARGRIDEAERYALAANETVGREDAWSRALAVSSLGLVRAAQGRFDEAEALLAKASRDRRAHRIQHAEAAVAAARRGVRARARYSPSAVLIA